MSEIDWTMPPVPRSASDTKKQQSFFNPFSR